MDYYKLQQHVLVVKDEDSSEAAVSVVTFSSPKKKVLSQVCILVRMYVHDNVYVTGPWKTGLIYTKYTCLYYGMYLLFCMCYPESVNFIAFLMEFCIYDDLLDTYDTGNR